MAISTAAALIISAVVAAGSAGYGAYSQNQAAKQAEKAEEFNAQIADENAKASERNAQALRDKAAYDEEMHRERVKKLLKSQRAAYGASGVSTEGSPMMVQADTEEQGDLDALAIRKSGTVEALQMSNLAAQQRMEGQLYRLKGRNYLAAGKSQATGTMLSAGSSIISSYAR